MCRKTTAGGAISSLFLAAGIAFAQTAASGIAPGAPSAPIFDWRHIGNSAVELALPSPATGPVDRVWYSSDGETLYARTHSGRVFQTVDLENWKAAREGITVPPVETDAVPVKTPEPGARVRLVGTRAYGFAQNAFRSDDAGVNWVNLTSYKGASILGAPVADLAVSPKNADEVTVSNAAGIWRSVDAGLTWTGLNTTLPNLPVRRLFALPNGMHGVKVGLAINGAPELEWVPGEKSAWRVSDDSDTARENQLKQIASQALGATITAVGSSGDALYAGSADGRLWASADRGTTWSAASTLEGGPVEAIYVDAKDPRTALAAFGAYGKPVAAGVKPVHVARTMNAGLFWDDFTANLPESGAHGIAADRSSGAIYVATDAGVFYTATALGTAGRPNSWTAVGNGLPAAPAEDVKLDAGGNQLYVAMDGYGVFSTIAPHRFRDVRVVNAADYSARPAAPGSLLSVLGAHVSSAQAGGTTVPVLTADDTASQIQVPFDVQGQSISLAMQSSNGTLVTGLPLRDVSPAIFVDPDGAPMVLDGDSGVLLDAMKPAHSGGRIQVFATGLGRVDPDWPTGTPAPLSDSPKVIAHLQAYLDQAPIEVSRAVLAPGYVGFYLIEIELPRIVNAGPAELYIEAEGQPSNHVRLYIEP